jgi:hypothetical protein
MLPKSKLYPTLILELVLYWTESHRCSAYHKKPAARIVPAGPDEVFGDTEMMEITGFGVGLMMTGVAVAAGGLLLEAALLMMCRSLLTPSLTASLESVPVRLD